MTLREALAIRHAIEKQALYEELKGSDPDALAKIEASFEKADAALVPMWIKPVYGDDVGEAYLKALDQELASVTPP